MAFDVLSKVIDSFQMRVKTPIIGVALTAFVSVNYKGLWVFWNSTPEQQKSILYNYQPTHGDYFSLDFMSLNGSWSQFNDISQALYVTLLWMLVASIIGPIIQFIFTSTNTFIRIGYHYLIGWSEKYRFKALAQAREAEVEASLDYIKKIKSANLDQWPEERIKLNQDIDGLRAELKELESSNLAMIERCKDLESSNLAMIERCKDLDKYNQIKGAVAGHILEPDEWYEQLSENTVDGYVNINERAYSELISTVGLIRKSIQEAG